MATRRVIKAALHNFLGTLTSRYSDHDGYWIFGFAVSNFDVLEVDLLATLDERPDATVSFAIKRLAITRFREQLERNGADPAQVREAGLTIQQLPGEVVVHVGDHPSLGHELHFTAVAHTDLGTTYRCENTISVAPHDPQFERRSARA